MKLDLRYYGDPILRKKAEPIAEITPEIKQLANDMIETMLAMNGIGLAAPQVGHLLRMFVSIVVGEDENGEILYGEPSIYINPHILNPSEATVERSEGCMSIPQLYLPIIRPLSIRIEATDIEGNPFSRECYGYLARCMMHENDHLNGVLHIDRIKGKKRNEIEPILRRIKLKYYKAS